MILRFPIMFKKSLILSLVLLLAGGALFGWAFSEQRKERQRLKERRERLKADLSKIDEVMGAEIDTRHFAGVGLTYDESVKGRSAEYAKQEEKRELALTLSGVFTLTGGTILGWLLLLGSVRGLIRGFSFLGNLLTGTARKEAVDKRPAQAAAGGKEAKADAGESKNKADAGQNRDKPEAGASENKSEEPKTPYFAAWKQTQEQKQGGRSEQRQERQGHKQQRQEQHEHKGEAEKRTGAVKDSGRQNVNKSFAGRQETKAPSRAAVSKGKSAFESRDTKGGMKRVQAGWAKSARRGARQGASRSESDRIAVLLSDEESVESDGQFEVKTEGVKMKTSRLDSPESHLKLEDSLKAQTEDLEKQMAEFKQMAQSVQQTAIEHSNPVNESLKELTQQVSAIREYAAHQQERVKKLQEGYDWNIIKNFCLRVIRCIDNLQNRIEMLAERAVDNTDLKEVRDELVFALESNGVEQFQPQINSDYRGQEKNAEAVKEKEGCSDAKLAGKIAKVLRPGYQYFIDEENVRVIRAAQVKLYG